MERFNFGDFNTYNMKDSYIDYIIENSKNLVKDEDDNFSFMVEKIERSLNFEKGFFEKFYSAITPVITYLESEGCLQDTNYILSHIKGRNEYLPKESLCEMILGSHGAIMNNDRKSYDVKSHNNDVDNVLCYIVLKAILTYPTKTDAYKLGLIDSKGRLIRKPETDAEKKSISNFDLLMFQLRRYLGGRFQFLLPLNWLQAVGNNYRLQNIFGNIGAASRMSIVRRTIQDLDLIFKRG